MDKIAGGMVKLATGHSSIQETAWACLDRCKTEENCFVFWFIFIFMCAAHMVCQCACRGQRATFGSSLLLYVGSGVRLGLSALIASALILPLPCFVSTRRDPTWPPAGISVKPNWSEGKERTKFHWKVPEPGLGSLWQNTEVPGVN